MDFGFTDIDECTNGGSTPCPDANAICVNKNGSFECQCHKGYERVTPESNCTGKLITKARVVQCIIALSIVSVAL